MKPKQILILTSDMGFGHRSTANAITATLESRYGEAVHVEVINAFDHKSIPSVVRDQQTEYDHRVRESPQFYQASYLAMDWPISTSLLEIGLTALLFQALSDILKQVTPDLIIVTHPMYLEPLNTIFRVAGRTIPIITIVTDLGTVQKIWFNDVSKITFVPTERVYDLAIQAKLPASTVKITGIPVHPQINDENRSPAEIRSSLGLDPAKTTVLVVGSSRVSNLLDAVQVLNHSNQPIQLIVVAGGDDAVYAALQEMEWHLPVTTYNFVNNMPALMHAADFIVCKAGGLVVTESLACGLPILLIDVIEGQETGNAEFVVNNDAGELARKPLEMLETLFHWMSDDRKHLQTLAENARKVGRPHAADEICEQALALMTAQD